MKNSNKRKTFLIVTLIIMVCLITLSLTACSVFDKAFDFFKGNSHDETQNNNDKPAEKTVSSVKIDVISGLTKNPDNTYTAKLNTPFVLKLILNSDAPENPACKWYTKTASLQKQIEGESGTELTYSFSTITSETVVISAKANGVDSDNKISIKVEYATLDNVVISSSTDTIISDTINVDLADLHTMQFDVSWNETALPDETVCTVKWYLDEDPTPVCTEKSYSYLPSAVVGTHTVKAEVTDNSATPIVKSATVTINIIEIFLPIDKVELSLESGATALGSGETTQYVQKSTSPSSITVSAQAYPVAGINTSAPVTWVWSHYDSTESEHVDETISDVDGEVTFTPAYGENYVTAIIEGVESKHIAIICLNSSDYESNKQAIEDAFVWEKGVYNHYLTCQEDFNAAISYLASKRVTTTNELYSEQPEKTFYYVLPSYFEFTQNAEKTGTINIALNSLDEAGSFAWRSSGNFMYFDTETVFSNPTENYSPATDVEQATNVILHYSEIPSSDRRTSLPIDSNPEYPEKITNSDMLWRVISWGYKPTFNTDAVGTKLSALYDEAREVLTMYVKETDTDVEKVRTIYEWIAQKVDYDYAMLEASATLGKGEGLHYNAYSLEGIFTDADGEGHGQGVCDARSKAFVLLCGMENIKAIRITGFGKGENHAWNKVFIDADGNGIKNWYFCDPTWGDRGISDGSATKKEKLTMQYFLVTDEYVKTSHNPTANAYNPVANTTYNYYQNTTIENGIDSFDLYLDSNAELEIALKYAKDNHLCLDFRIDTSIWKSQSIFKSAISLSGVSGSYSFVALDETNGNYMIEFA